MKPEGKTCDRKYGMPVPFCRYAGSHSGLDPGYSRATLVDLQKCAVCKRIFRKLYGRKISWKRDKIVDIRYFTYQECLWFRFSSLSQQIQVVSAGNSNVVGSWSAKIASINWKLTFLFPEKKCWIILTRNELTHADLVCIPHHILLYVDIVTVLLISHGEKLTTLKTSSLIFACFTRAQISSSKTFMTRFPNLRSTNVLGSKILASNWICVTFALTRDVREWFLVSWWSMLFLRVRISLKSCSHCFLTSDINVC